MERSWGMPNCLPSRGPRQHPVPVCLGHGTLGVGTACPRGSILPSAPASPPGFRDPVPPIPCHRGERRNNHSAQRPWRPAEPDLRTWHPRTPATASLATVSTTPVLRASEHRNAVRPHRAARLTAAEYGLVVDLVAVADRCRRAGPGYRPRNGLDRQHVERFPLLRSIGWSESH